MQIHCFPWTVNLRLKTIFFGNGYPAHWSQYDVTELSPFSFQVYWMFEQRRLDPRSDSRYVVGTDGSLTIRGLRYEDSGRYYCIAENSIGVRQSQLGHLTVSGTSILRRKDVLLGYFTNVRDRNVGML